MTHPADDDVMVYMTVEEWEAAKERALADLGMTYEELADCARRSDYPSYRARALWVMIGHSDEAG